MRIAVISDIRGNLAVLVDVLAEHCASRRRRNRQYLLVIAKRPEAVKEALEEEAA
jgi:hypothetical protein